LFGGNAPNTYSGDTLVKRGLLLLGKPNGTLAVPGHLFIGSGEFNSIATVEHWSGFNVGGSVTVNRGGLWDLNGFSETFDNNALQGRVPLTLTNGGSVQSGVGVVFIPVGGDVVVNPGPAGRSFISGHLAFEPGSHHFIVASRSVPF